MVTDIHADLRKILLSQETMNLKLDTNKEQLQILHDKVCGNGVPGLVSDMRLYKTGLDLLKDEFSKIDTRGEKRRAFWLQVGMFVVATGMFIATVFHVCHS